MISAITGFFTNLFNQILQFLMNWIVLPAIQLVLSAIKYIISGFLYQISVFLLQIMDFLEMIFRALAGLSPVGNSFHIEFSYGGKVGGDLLIQLLTSKEIMTAFQATAIVGIFLLIITTIFQMIKVEYTTEGAENNKTKIIGKSLKSLSNLILIPVLCVLGVFIGNQVLELIDTATKGGEGATMSGTLWVTAGAEAVFDNTSIRDIIARHALTVSGGLMPGRMGQAATTAAPLMATYDVIEMIITKGKEVVDYATHKNSADELLDSEKTNGWDLKAIVGINADIISSLMGEETDEETIKSNFMKNDPSFHYANPGSVITYYNIFDVNYLVLLAGACTILKCLLHISFGMIDRLYRCLALFIVAPFVIGMSPVKDSLASWRSNFIGKALAAYGTIISVNLFYTIVGLLLEVDVVVKTSWGFGMSGGFYEGIIKMLFVVVGVLMIEKLAGEMGQYFGASDGLATGKALAKEAAEPVKQAIGAAVTVAAGVASGGATLVGSIGGMAKKMAGARDKGDEAYDAAIAGGKTKKEAKAASRQAYREQRRQDRSEFLANTKLGKSMKAWKDSGHIEENEKKLDEVKDAREGLAKSIGNKQEIVNDVDEYERLAKKGVKNLTEEDTKRQYEIREKYGWKSVKDMHKMKNNAKDDIDKLNAIDDKRKKEEEGLEKDIESGKLGKAQQAVTWGAIRNRAKTGITSILPKDLTSIGDNWHKQEEAGAANSEYLKSALETVKKNRSGMAEKNAESDPIIASYVKFQQSQMNTMLKDATSKKMLEEQQETNVNLQKMNKTIEKWVDAMENARKNGDTEGQNYYANLIRGKQDEMQTINSSITFTGLNASNNLDSAFETQSNNIKLEIAKLHAIFDKNKDKSAKDIIKALDDHMAELGKKGDDKMLKQLQKTLDEIKGMIGK